MAQFKNAVLTTMALLSAMAASAAMPSASAATAAPALSEGAQARLTHARELLGKYYSKSAVRAGERLADMSPRIHSWTRRGMKASPRPVTKAVANAILIESKRHSFDPVFIAAVIQSESSFNPKSRGTSGEIGLMQIMPATGKWIARKIHLEWKGEKTLLDPVMNVRIGTAYLSMLRDQFDNQGRLYLSAYNMGPRNVERAMEKNIKPKEYALRVMKNYVGFYSELSTRRMPASAARKIR